MSDNGILGTARCSGCPGLLLSALLPLPDTELELTLNLSMCPADSLRVRNGPRWVWTGVFPALIFQSPRRECPGAASPRACPAECPCSKSQGADPNLGFTAAAGECFTLRHPVTPGQM